MSALDFDSEPNVQQAMNTALTLHYTTRSAHAAVIDRFGPVRPFASAIQWQQRHIDCLRKLFDQRGWVSPPDKDDAPLAAADPQAACIAALRTTREFIALYEVLIETALSDDEVTAAFRDILRDLKTKHLPAFERCED